MKKKPCKISKNKETNLIKLPEDYLATKNIKFHILENLEVVNNDGQFVQHQSKPMEELPKNYAVIENIAIKTMFDNIVVTHPKAEAYRPSPERDLFLKEFFHIEENLETIANQNILNAEKYYS